MKVCICGGGNLGHVVAGYLAAKSDCEVSLLTRQPERWQSTLHITTPEGEVLQGTLQKISSSADEVVTPADLVLLCLPGFSIREVLQQIRPALRPHTPVGSIVSSTGFFFEAFEQLPSDTPLFGFQRVPFISRLTEYGRSASLLGYKPSLSISVEQTSSKEHIRQTIETLFHRPTQLLSTHYEVSLTNSNPILHPSRLYSLWKDWHEGVVYPTQPLFYEAWTDEASELLIAMDNELHDVIASLNRQQPALNCQLSTILDYYESHDAPSLTRKLHSIEAFKGILAPMKAVEGGFVPDFQSRYFTEDFPYGLQIIQNLARKQGVPTPTIDKVMEWGNSQLSTFNFQLSTDLRSRFNPDGSQLRRLQLRMLDILLEIDRICKKHHIRYWLSSGTLIGALRHGGFIPWDDDLDIEMMRSDYLRLMQVLPTELPDWLALQNSNTDPNYFFFYAKIRDRRSKMLENTNYDRMWKEQGIYIDIFPMERHPIGLHKLTEKTVGHMYKIWRTSTDDAKSIKQVRRIFDFNDKFVFPILRFICRMLPSKVITSGMGIPYHNPRYEDEIFPLTTHMFEGYELPVPGNADAHLRHIYGDYMQLPDLDKLAPHVAQLEM
jgi:phosphorylcholine metabolism protein LicD